MLDNMQQDNRKFVYIFSGIMLFLYAYLAYNTPLTHDDWAWGSTIGLDRLKSWFDNYNGRYLGNIVVMILTRYEWLKILAMALCGMLLVVLSARLVTGDMRIKYIASSVVFFSVPLGMYAQTFGWVSGFSNYNVSIVLLLIYLCVISNILEEEAPKYNVFECTMVVPLGIATQLFMEHITIYSILMALAVISYTYYRFKKFYAVQFLYFGSTIIGAIIMFSNNAYSSIFAGNDGYRSVSVNADVSFLKKIFDVYTEEMYPFLFSNNIILNIIISMICIIILTKTSKMIASSNKVLKNTWIFFFVIYSLYKPLVVNMLRINNLFGKYTNEFEAIISFLFYCSIFLIVLFYIKEKQVKHKLIFYWISIGCISAPLVFVQPFGPRNFLASYTFFCIIVIELLVYVISKGYVNKQLIHKASIMLLSTLSVCYFYVFTMNGSVDRQRISHLHAEVLSGSKTIEFTHLPYESYLWGATPKKDSLFYKRLKKFHGIPDDVEINIIGYAKWSK